MAASDRRSAAMLRFVTDGDGAWIVVLMAATSVMQGVFLILPFQFTTIGLLEFIAGFAIAIGLLELVASMIQSNGTGGGRQLNALLTTLAGILVFSAPPGLNLTLYALYYLLGGAMVFSALLMILDLGSGNWWSMGRSMIGVSQFVLGSTLLIHPSFDMINALTVIGVLVLGSSFFAIVLYGSSRPAVARMDAAGAFLVSFPKLTTGSARAIGGFADPEPDLVSQIPVQRVDYDGIALRAAVHERKRRRRRARRIKARVKANATKLESAERRAAADAESTDKIKAQRTGDTGWSETAERVVPQPQGTAGPVEA